MLKYRLRYFQFSNKIEIITLIIQNLTMYIARIIEKKLYERVAQGKSILFLGPRQTGKTTLLQRFQPDLKLSFIVPRVRQRYEANPSILIDEVEALAEKLNYLPLVILDEVQKVPELMDCAQDLIDRQRAKFILTGSSARKLRNGKHINLLPGRVLLLHLDPLSLIEMNADSEKKVTSIDEFLFYGSLPKVWQSNDAEEREELLDAYVSLYLEDEIRAEAAVRNLAHFTRFLELAAAESGYIVNFSKLAQEIGVAHTTIASYYRLLEDCLIVEKIEPFLKTKTRRKLSKTPKYIFFDLGVRRIAAHENINPPQKHKGYLFEQWVGLEIIRMMRSQPGKAKLHYWRDHSGAEVDWVIDKNDDLTPIEVKWTENPTLADAKHLLLFLDEYSEAKAGFIICRIPRAMKLNNHIYALPWQDIASVLNE